MKMFGPKRVEKTGEWRRLHNEELYGLYSSRDRRMKWAGHVARVGERRDAYRVLVKIPEGKRQLERPRPRWEDNIKMDF